MKKILCILLIISTVFAFSACGGSKKAPEDYAMSKSLSELRTEISSKADLSEFFVLSGESLLDYTGITAESCAETLVLIPESSISADMIFIIKAADSDALENVKALLESYRDGRAAEFKSYAPEEHQRLSDTKVNVKGLYLWMVVSENSAEIEKLIGESIN